MASFSFRWIYNVFRWIYNVFCKLFNSHLVKELDRTMMDTSKDDEIEINSSSSSRRYDVFVSFRGDDIRKSFLSYLLKALDRKLIDTFKDHGIERSLQIAPELLSAIRESRILIVIFSKNYASSTWCLNELVNIHESYKKLDQMVIPVFYHVDPSHVRKQTGEFGKVFEETCKGQTKDQTQRWRQALVDVAEMAGEDLLNWPDEATMIETIAIDVLNKLTTPSDDFGDFVGIETHLKAMYSKLCLESDEVRMVGILGPSGIGKTTIARALFSKLSSQFHHRACVAYKRMNQDDFGMKLYWEGQFLSQILGQKDIKVDKLGVVEQRLKRKKVLIVLDDVDDLELLKTLVGHTGWFGSGSRIIVITQDRQLLKAHQINLVYEVEFPSPDVAKEIFCRYAFGQNSPPDGFTELAVEVAKLAGNLPLGLSVLGSSLRGRGKAEWMNMLPRLRNDLYGKIEDTLKVSYNRLQREDRELFLYIAFAFLFNGEQVSYIKDLLGDSVNIGLTMLTDKSLIRITPDETVEMHNLLQKLGREIVRAESIDIPGKRRFLVDAEEISDVFADNTGTETVRGIHFNASYINVPILIDKNLFKGMPNLQFLIVHDGRWWLKSESRLYLPQGLAYLPRKLRLLNWNKFPSKCLPSNYKGQYLVELIMEDSKLENLWEGTQLLGSLKKINMRNSRYLKEFPDLSYAINLERVYLFGCKSLVTLPSSIQNVSKLRRLNMGECTNLESFPTHVSLESLEYLNLKGCNQLNNFPPISLYSSTRFFCRELISTIRDRVQYVFVEDMNAKASPSSSRRWTYDVFLSFHGPDIRKSLLSHLLKELDRKLITTFKNTRIEISHSIGSALISGIRESRISIVIFSRTYASSSWCLDELVEIHNCFKELGQKVIPIFYEVNPSEVKKQTGEFGKFFKETCKGKTKEQKQRWMQALAEVVFMPGEDSQNWPDEAAMIEKIANDTLIELIRPWDCIGELVGLEAHIGNEFNIRKECRVEEE